MKECVMCKNLFQESRVTEKYCSAECSKNAKNNKRNKNSREVLNSLTKRECLICNKEFEVKPNSVTKKYCSKDCRKKAEKIFGNKNQIDLEYHNQKMFGGNKNKVLKRDNYKCQMCGNKSQLVIHHKDLSGQSEQANNEMNNLVTLCRKCHINIHRIL